MSATHPPTVIFAGETISYVAGKYSAEDYSLQFALNNGVDEPTVGDGEADETIFTVSLAAPSKPGRYAWAEVYTNLESGEVVYGYTGYLDVLPSALSKATPSIAAQMVAKLQAVMLLFASTDKQSVSFAGQSFSRASISEYQQQLVIWEAKLKAEQDAAAAAAGHSVGGFIHVNFLPPRGRCF